MNHSISAAPRYAPWNKGKLVGQTTLLKLKEIWAIRIRLQLAESTRELAPLNLELVTKLRSCDLVKTASPRVGHRERESARAIVMQRKSRGRSGNG